MHFDTQRWIRWRVTLLEADSKHTLRKTAGAGHGARFWPHKCPRSPQSELAAQQNPTCDIRHYQGGQWGCGHMWSLLDADQEIPWPDQPLEFVHKWRFHVRGKRN